ncbi:Polyhomeotic-like protein 3 [Taenia solium]|eukprot:TsM_000829300 transcript=TsM_000829300 gene=TsM_000829300
MLVRLRQNALEDGSRRQVSTLLLDAVCIGGQLWSGTEPHDLMLVNNAFFAKLEGLMLHSSYHFRKFDTDPLLTDKPIDRRDPSPNRIMNSSEIGLIPVQHKGESHDLSFVTAKSSAEVKSRDLPSSPSVSSTPSAEAIPSPTTASNGDEQHQRSTEVKFVTAAAAQIKRKRGRPRKYTFDPFPSQVGGASHTRLGLPSAFSTVETNGLLPNDPSGSGALDQPKKPRLGRPSKAYISASNGTDSPASMRSVEVKDPPHGSAIGAAAPEQTHQQQLHHDLVSSKFHSATVSTTLFPKIISYPTQSPALLNGHTNGVNGTPSSTANTAAQMAPSAAATLSTAPLKPSAPVLMEYYNGSFINGTVAGPAAALMSPPPPPPMPTTQLAAAACSTMEAGLIRRLLPQAEAAVSATRAGGYPGPHAWTAEMVGSFIATLPGCQNLARAFIENEIDGAALLCLEQHDLMSILKLKLGPAVKIFGAIRTLRQAFLSIPYNDLTADHSSMLAAVVSCFPPLTAASATQTSASATGSNAAFSINNLAVEEASSAGSPTPSGPVGVAVVNGTGGRGSPSLIVGTTEKPSH